MQDVYLGIIAAKCIEYLVFLKAGRWFLRQLSDYFQTVFVLLVSPILSSVPEDRKLKEEKASCTYITSI